MRKATRLFAAVLAVATLLLMLPASSMALDMDDPQKELDALFASGSGAWIEGLKKVNGIPVKDSDGKAYVTPTMLRNILGIFDILEDVKGLKKSNFLLDKNDVYLNGVKLEPGKTYSFRGQEFKFTPPGLGGLGGETFQLGSIEYTVPAGGWPVHVPVIDEEDDGPADDGPADDSPADDETT